MAEWKTKQADFTRNILAGDEEAAVSLARISLEQGATPVEFFENCISPSLQDIGKRFETLDIFLPEMVTAADTVEVVNSEVINPVPGPMVGQLQQPYACRTYIQPYNWICFFSKQFQDSPIPFPCQWFSETSYSWF